MVDFAGLLETPIYQGLGTEITLATPYTAPQTLTALDKMIEVSEPGASGVAIPTLRRGVVLRLADLTAKGFDPDLLSEAEVTLGGTAYKVAAVAPTGNEREIALLLVEDN